MLPGTLKKSQEFFMKSRKCVSVALGLVGLLLAQAVRAETLADRAPADAIGFAAWAGAENLGTAYQQSHLKGFIETLNLPEIIAREMQKEAEKNAANPARLAEQNAVKEILLTMFNAPTAVYVGPVDFADARNPAPRIALYSKVGNEKAQRFAGQLALLIEKGKKPNQPPAAATAAGDFLLVTIGALPDFDKRLTAAAPADSLGALPDYQKTIATVGGEKAAALLYLNGPAALKTILDAINAKGGEDAEKNSKIFKTLFADSIRHCAFAGNFDGPNWTSHMFFGLAENRTGLVNLVFDHKALPEESMKLAPKEATWAGVTRMDVPKLMQAIRDLAAQVDPRGAKGIDMGLQQFFALTAVDFQKDVVDTMGDAFVAFGIPDAKGNTFENATMASKVKDPQKLETALTTIESVASLMLGNRGGGGGGGGGGNAVQFTTESLPAPNEKVSMHVISTDQISPAWTIHDGVLYFSLAKAGVQRAVESVAKNSRLTDNPQFADLYKKLGVKEISGFSYIDYPKVATEIHPLIAGAIEQRKAMNPDDKNPFVLPPVEKINAHLTPALSVYWTDKDGHHAKGTGPLPMLEMITPATMLQWSLMLGTYTRQGRPAPEPALP
jgi:hypothetical protein